MYMNQITIITLNKALGSYKPMISSFNIADKIDYVLDLFSFKAVSKQITFVLAKDPCFPSEVMGFMMIFELIFASTISYLISNLSSTELKIYTKLCETIENKFILGFSFEFPSNNILSFDNLNKIFELPTSDDETQSKTGLIADKIPMIISYLNGSLSIVKKDNSLLTIEIKLEFTLIDPSIEMVPLPKINIYRIRPQGNYTKKWNFALCPINKDNPNLKKNAYSTPKISHNDLSKNDIDSKKEFHHPLSQSRTLKKESNNTHKKVTPNGKSLSTLSILKKGYMAIKTEVSSISNKLNVPIIDMNPTAISEEHKIFTLLDDLNGNNSNENGASWNYIDKVSAEYIY